MSPLQEVTPVRWRGTGPRATVVGGMPVYSRGTGPRATVLGGMPVYSRGPVPRATVVGCVCLLLLFLCAQPSLAFQCGTPELKARLQSAPTGIEGPAPVAPSAPVHPAAPALPLGTERTFFAPDFRTLQQYTLTAVLRGIGEFCYIYVEEAEWERRVTQRTVAAILRAFEETTPAAPRGSYQTLTELFGQPPDVDGNGRVILLLLNIRDGAGGAGGAEGGTYTAGFFNPADQGRGVLRQPGRGGLVVRSNRADMLYIDTFPLDINGEAAHNVIAHELQHLIHWRHDSREDIWVDEGCADYAAFVCGYVSREHLDAFEKRPSVSLTAWPDAAANAMSHYGAAFLWMLFLHERYGGPETLQRIVQHPGTSMNGIAAVLAEVGHPVRIEDVFSAWKVANYVSDYAHVDLRLTPTRVHRLRIAEAGTGGLPLAVTAQTLGEFAAAYLVFESDASPFPAGITLGFSGETPAHEWGVHLIEYRDDVTYTVSAMLLTHGGTGAIALSGDALTKVVLVPGLHAETPRFSPRSATYEYSATRGADITFSASVLPNPVLPRYWDIVAVPNEPLLGLAPTVTLMQDARPYREAQPMRALQEGELYRYTFHLEPAISPGSITWQLFLEGRPVGEGILEEY